MKIIYNYDPNGYYCGQDLADESPLEPGIYLIPALATDQEPPTVGENQLAKFVNGGWTLEDIPILEPAPEPTAEETKQRQYSNINTTYSTKLTQILTAIQMASARSDTVTVAKLNTTYVSVQAEWVTKIKAVASS
jgi:hypothetical protein